MGYYSNRCCFSIEGDEPQLKSLDVCLPEDIKIPEWFDEYSTQLLSGEISDGCVDMLVMLQGIRSLYSIKYAEYPKFVYRDLCSELATNYLYNVFLAVNYLLTKNKELSTDLHAVYQTAYWLMPPINKYNPGAYVYLHGLFKAALGDSPRTQTITEKVNNAIIAHDIRKLDADNEFVCWLYHTKDDRLFELVDVGGGKTDILMPVFSGRDSAMFECKLVPTFQAVVNSLRGYSQPKTAPLPEYAECGNVASKHFADDFRQYILPNYAYAGKASISAYLNNREDDTPDTSNYLDTFYKFVKVKETDNGV
jgi:hypothetical protein